MDWPTLLDPPTVTTPAVSQILTSLLRLHPWLSTLQGVRAAVHAVTVRYGRRLSAASDATPPTLDAAQVRRELLFLTNTAQGPLASDPTISAVDLFVVACAEITRSARNVPDEAGRANRAFELAIARIVHVARVPALPTRSR